MRTVLLISALAMVAACEPTTGLHAGDMLPGQLTSLANGQVLPMQIEVTPATSGSGRLTASNPATGEQFSGNYTAIQETKTVMHSANTLFGTDTRSVESSDMYAGTAVLVGDKGHVLNLTMSIKAGNPPHGIGEAVDNKGTKYNLQF